MLAVGLFEDVVRLDAENLSSAQINTAVIKQQPSDVFTSHTRYAIEGYA